VCGLDLELIEKIHELARPLVPSLLLFSSFLLLLKKYVLRSALQTGIMFQIYL
jgi:hypothetical protein